MTTMAAPTMAAMPAMPAYGGGSFVGAPVMPAMAAPTMAAMPAMPSYGGGSFVAAPPMAAYGAAMPAMQKPQNLTAGMPDPASIEHQKQMLMRQAQQEKAQSYVTIDQYATYGNSYV